MLLPVPEDTGHHGIDEVDDVSQGVELGGELLEAGSTGVDDSGYDVVEIVWAQVQACMLSGGDPGPCDGGGGGGGGPHCGGPWGGPCCGGPWNWGRAAAPAAKATVLIYMVEKVHCCCCWDVCSEGCAKSESVVCSKSSCAGKSVKKRKGPTRDER